MVIVDGEALGSILVSELTKTGKPRKDAHATTPEMLAPPQPDDVGESAEKSAPTPPPPSPAKSAPAKSAGRKEGA